MPERRTAKERSVWRIGKHSVNLFLSRFPCLGVGGTLGFLGGAALLFAQSVGRICEVEQIFHPHSAFRVEQVVNRARGIGYRLYHSCRIVIELRSFFHPIVVYRLDAGI